MSEFYFCFLKFTLAEKRKAYTVYAFILGRCAAADVVMPSAFMMMNNASHIFTI